MTSTHHRGQHAEHDDRTEGVPRRQRGVRLDHQLLGRGRPDAAVEPLEAVDEQHGPDGGREHDGRLGARMPRHSRAAAPMIASTAMPGVSATTLTPFITNVIGGGAVVDEPRPTRAVEAARAAPRSATWSTTAACATSSPDVAPACRPAPAARHGASTDAQRGAAHGQHDGGEDRPHRRDRPGDALPDVREPHLHAPPSASFQPSSRVDAVTAMRDAVTALRTQIRRRVRRLLKPLRTTWSSTTWSGCTIGAATPTCSSAAPVKLAPGDPGPPHHARRAQARWRRRRR